MAAPKIDYDNASRALIDAQFLVSMRWCEHGR